MQKKNLLYTLLGIILLFLIWSAINPKGYGIWFLEVFPVLIGVPILIFTYRRFEFTTMIYVFVTIHSIILIIGGHYTYAENPFFEWIKVNFNLSRNYYDRLGHFAQGFFPALIIREFLLRKTKLQKGAMLFFLVVSVCLALSAFYELIEWWASISLTPGTGNAFLGSQGDIWDSQWDMFLALIGSSTSLLLFSKLQDKQMKEMKKR